MAKQPPKKLKREPASPPPGATSESVVQPTATTPLFPEPPLSPQSRRRTGMIRMGSCFRWRSRRWRARAATALSR